MDFKQIKYLFLSSVFPWVTLFVVSCFLVKQLDNENPKTRFAALRAMTESHELHIDKYKDWTADWSLSPNGHYYSNKAPGAILIGLPIFAVIDNVTAHFEVKPKKEVIRPYPSDLVHIIFITILQIFPFALAIIWGAKKLKSRGCCPLAIHFFALGALFGNTASIYMNGNFGHGLAALFLLIFIIQWIDGNYAWASFWLSLTVLTDYMALLVLPLFILTTLARSFRIKAVVSAVLGAIPGAILWWWYHMTAFNSPFALATSFNNPIYIVEDYNNLIPGFSLFPAPDHIWNLLFGFSRGILFTQPWVLVLVFLSPLIYKAKGITASLCILLTGSFAISLWINAGYSLWEAGWCAGPRYLAFLFPAYAFFAALVYEKLPHAARKLLWCTLGISLIYRLLIFPHSNIAPIEPIWKYYFTLYLNTPNESAIAMLLLILSLSCLTFLWVRKRQRNLYLREF